MNTSNCSRLNDVIGLPNVSNDNPATVLIAVLSWSIDWPACQDFPVRIAPPKCVTASAGELAYDMRRKVINEDEREWIVDSKFARNLRGKLGVRTIFRSSVVRFLALAVVVTGDDCVHNRRGHCDGAELETGSFTFLVAVGFSQHSPMPMTKLVVDLLKVLGRAVSVQKANPTIRRLSEDRPLDARKPGHSSSREEMRKKLPDGAISADPKLKAKPIVVIAPCAPESTPRQTTATPDSSFYSTTADPSNSIGSDALEEASLTWTERPKYVQLSALLSVTDVKGATVNSTPKLQPSWIRSDVRSQVVKPTGKPTTCPDVDIGECCENRTSTEAVKLPISSSTPPKVASLIVDTTLAQDHDNQSHKPDHGEPNSPSYTQLATLIAGDSDDHTGAKEKRLRPNKPYTTRQIRKLLAGFKVQSSEKTSLMGAPPKELPGAATQRSKQHRGTFPTKPRQNAQEAKQTRDRPLSISEPGRPEEVKERATSSNGRNFRPRGKKLRPPKLIGPRKPGSHRAKKTLQMKSNPRNHQSREQTNMPQRSLRSPRLKPDVQLLSLLTSLVTQLSAPHLRRQQRQC
ncbi:hypothetical protein CLF_109278 [Clonorchis sinensis]|uniref:Uncharacterized protein n=1 Tax=Clonorchis sinensis TaxID=79923 RepID=G7YJ53_CLOSI|nr:hypothetical protein CLF_109278 [Clonorchis sinensis]